jgi:hypothetical protein
MAQVQEYITWISPFDTRAVIHLNSMPIIEATFI